MLLGGLGPLSYLILGLGLLELGWGGYLLLTDGVRGHAVALLVTGGLLVVWGLLTVRGHRRDRRIRRSGVRGVGRITRMRQTGAVENYVNPGIELELTIQLTDGRPPYPATTRLFVPAILVGRLGPGVGLPVRVDPQDPNRVVVLWESDEGSAGL